MSLHHSKIKEDGNLECLKCYGHKHPVEPFLTYSQSAGRTSIFFHCSECRNSSADSPDQKHEVDYQVYPKNKLYVLSVAGIPKLPQLQKVKAIEPMNFFDMQVDKLIVNVQSPGYYQNGLIYLPNKNLLVACSRDGRIDIFSMGDEVEPVTNFNVGNSVKCVKYIVTASGKSFLALGVSTEIQIYEIQENEAELRKILDCQADVRGLEYVARELTEDGKLVSVSADNMLREWDITSFKCCSERSLKENNIIEPPSRILYLREKGMLVLNSPNEINLIKLDEKNFSKKIACRGAGISMGYLPNRHQLVVRNDRISVALLDLQKDFERTVSKEQTIFGSLVSETTYIANQDETQMIYNRDSRTIAVHNFIRANSPKGFDDLNSLVQSVSAIETIPDQNRLLIGGDTTGTILVLRTNLKSTPVVPRTHPIKIVEEEQTNKKGLFNNAIPLGSQGSSLFANKRIGSGGLFGNSNSSNNTSLFSNSGASTGGGGLFAKLQSSGSGGLFSNLNNSSSGGLLFSNNNRPGNSGGLFSNNSTSPGLFSNVNRSSLFNNNTTRGGGGLFSNITGGSLFGNSRRSGGSVGKKLPVSKSSGSTAKKTSTRASASRKTTKSSLNKRALASASKKKVEKVKTKTSRPAKPTSKNQKVKEAKSKAVKAIARVEDKKEELLNGVVKFVRLRDNLKNSKNKKKKEETVWVMFPEDDEEEGSKEKRGRSKSPKAERGKKEKQKSEEKEKDRSQSRSKSQSASSKKSIHETIKGAKELVKGIRKKMNARRKQANH